MNTSPEQLLKEKGVAPTPQRLAVFKAVSERRDHPSVDMVFSALRKKMPTLSKTTVYTTMQLLAKNALINVVHVDGDELHYDGVTDFHAHFHCKKCGKLVDVALACAAKDGCPAILPEGFEAETQEITFYGLCADCKKIS